MEKVKRNYSTLYIMIALCVAPVLLSYISYYWIKPQGRTNYGTLLDPRLYPTPDLQARQLDGKPASLAELKGKWLLVQNDVAQCAQACQDKLIDIRQLRLMQGKESDRIERVWLVTDDQPVDIMLMKLIDGTHILRVNAAALKTWLPVESGQRPSDAMYLIDPLGNLMMRYPAQPPADLEDCRVSEELVKAYGVERTRVCQIQRISKDLNKLLKASRIG